ncbi:MAG: hypothetical protein QXL51_01310 [Candidatus Aenigmatarchaeota archaeon]
MNDLTVLILALIGLDTVFLIVSLIFLKEIKVAIQFIKNSIILGTVKPVQKTRPTKEEIKEDLVEVIKKMEEME